MAGKFSDHHESIINFYEKTGKNITKTAEMAIIEGIKEDNAL